MFLIYGDKEIILLIMEVMKWGVIKGNLFLKMLRVDSKWLIWGWGMVRVVFKRFYEIFS